MIGAPPPLDPLYRLVRPRLFAMDAEAAHERVLGLGARVSASRLATGLTRLAYGPSCDPILETELCGLSLSGPIGLAAGLDKNGVAIDLWAALGFGFVEVGTVTPGEGQPGNEPPRLARHPGDRALLNRMGFNNLGSRALAGRLAARRTRIPVGANLGKAKQTPNERAIEDYLETLRDTWDGCDYVVLNVSSPNTPGLRDLQAVSSLEPLIAAVTAENRALATARGRAPRPVLLKIAPDLADEDLDAVAALALDRGLDGLIATNTTIREGALSEPPAFVGGVSGAPLTARALAVTRRLHRATGGRLPIVGVGGIGTADEAWARIRAGASALQIYSAFVYEGPSLVAALHAGLAVRLRRDGYTRLRDAVGVDGGADADGPTTGADPERG